MTTESEQIVPVDDTGNPLGFPVLRQTAHQDGIAHQTVHVWIVSPEGRLLLQKRAPHKLAHPENGTSPVQGM